MYLNINKDESIAICLLTWNNIENTKIFFESLKPEIKTLNKNYNILFYVVDNGSTDGTFKYLVNYDMEDIPVNVTCFEKNEGIGIAKNELILNAVKNKCKYMFMFDNDIKILNNSMSMMIEYMDKHPNVGCFGQHIDYFTKDLNDSKINEPLKEYGNIERNVKSGYEATRAWTHYGIYQVKMFQNGVKFDTTGPMGLAGYGFDDDDLGNQIVNSGYYIDCFKNIIYHNINSSISNLEKTSGLNFKNREDYFNNKWRLPKNE